MWCTIAHTRTIGSKEGSVPISSALYISYCILFPSYYRKHHHYLCKCNALAQIIFRNWIHKIRRQKYIYIYNLILCSTSNLFLKKKLFWGGVTWLWNWNGITLIFTKESLLPKCIITVLFCNHFVLNCTVVELLMVLTEKGIVKKITLKRMVCLYSWIYFCWPMSKDMQFVTLCHIL